MKYLAIIDGDDFKDFNGFNDNSKKMAVHKGHFTKMLPFAPISEPLFISKNGVCFHLTEGHIKVLIEYEKEQQEPVIIDAILKQFGLLEKTKPIPD